MTPCEDFNWKKANIQGSCESAFSRRLGKVVQSKLSRDTSQRRPKELGIWLSLPKPQSPECRDIRRRKQPRHIGKELDRAALEILESSNPHNSRNSVSALWLLGSLHYLCGRFPNNNTSVKRIKKTRPAWPLQSSDVGRPRITAKTCVFGDIPNAALGSSKTAKTAI